LRLEQRRSGEAAQLANEALSLCSEGCTPRIRSEYLLAAGRAYDQMGSQDRAVEALQISLETYEKFRGSNHIGTIKRRISLADALCNSRKVAEGARVLAQINPAALAELSPSHPVRADLERLEAAIALENKNFTVALKMLEESYRIFRERFGPKHWRTERVRNELNRAQAAWRAKDSTKNSPPTSST
jgi:hypothetical protein